MLRRSTFDPTSPYYLGIASVDSEHRYLIELVENLVHASCAGGMGRNCSELVSYVYMDVMTHIKNEEVLLDLSDWPDLVEHKHLHRELQIAMDDMCDDICTKPEKIVEFGELLTKWLHDHILIEDAKFAEHVKKYLQSKP